MINASHFCVRVSERVRASFVRYSRSVVDATLRNDEEDDGGGGDYDGFAEKREES